MSLAPLQSRIQDGGSTLADSAMADAQRRDVNAQVLSGRLQRSLDRNYRRAIRSGDSRNITLAAQALSSSGFSPAKSLSSGGIQNSQQVVANATAASKLNQGLRMQALDPRSTTPGAAAAAGGNAAIPGWNGVVGNPANGGKALEQDAGAMGAQASQGAQGAPAAPVEQTPAQGPATQQGPSSAPHPPTAVQHPVWMDSRQQFAKDLMSSSLINSGDPAAMQKAIARGTNNLGLTEDQIKGFLDKQGVTGIDPSALTGKSEARALEDKNNASDIAEARVGDAARVALNKAESEDTQALIQKSRSLMDEAMADDNSRNNQDAATQQALDLQLANQTEQAIQNKQQLHAINLQFRKDEEANKGLREQPVDPIITSRRARTMRMHERTTQMVNDFDLTGGERVVNSGTQSEKDMMASRSKQLAAEDAKYFATRFSPTK